MIAVLVSFWCLLVGHKTFWVCGYTHDGHSTHLRVCDRCRQVVPL